MKSSRKLESLKMSPPLYIKSILRRFGIYDLKAACRPRGHASLRAYLLKRISLLLEILAPILIPARFQKAPAAYCCCGVKLVLRYLRGTHDYLIF